MSYRYEESERDELVLRDRDADANSGNGLEERLYALQDALYNVTALVNTSGSVQERFAYTPYGESTVLDADMAVDGTTDYDWEHRYTGRRLDPVSGLQLNRHRYYHQQLGRWCTRDPLGYDDGLSLYSAYFIPLGMDPSGLSSVTACENVCGRQYPHWWQRHLFIGCIVGCNPDPVVDQQIDNVETVVCTTFIVEDVVTVPSGEGAAGCAATKTAFSDSSKVHSLGFQEEL